MSKEEKLMKWNQSFDKTIKSEIKDDDISLSQIFINAVCEYHDKTGVNILGSNNLVCHIFIDCSRQYYLENIDDNEYVYYIDVNIVHDNGGIITIGNNPEIRVSEINKRILKLTKISPKEKIVSVIYDKRDSTIDNIMDAEANRHNHASFIEVMIYIITPILLAIISILRINLFDIYNDEIIIALAVSLGILGLVLLK